MSLAVAEPKSKTVVTRLNNDAALQTALQYLRHDQLVPSKLNPRKHPRTDGEINELADSIADKGILQNLVARAIAGGKYEIAAGEGRWRAVGFLAKRPATVAGHWPADRGLPVIVRTLSDEQLIEVGLIENLQRNDLHPLDEGRAYKDLYELAMKRGGKSAAANAVRELAERLHKTPRFVQKRIALARDLAPSAAKLFENGRIDLAAATLLAAAPAKEQERLAKRGAKDDDRRDDSLSASELAWNITRNLRVLANALFDVKLYTGETVEHRGKIFARDTKAFDELQRAALDPKIALLQKRARAGEIAFVERASHFESWRYDKVAKGGGIFIEQKTDGAVVFHEGLKKRPTSGGYGGTYNSAEYRENQKKRERQKARDNARMILDPRIQTVFAQVTASPKIALATSLYFALGEIDYQSKFHALFQNRNGGRLTVYNWDEETQAAGRKVLRSAGSMPKGEAMLAWLLKQSLTTLAEAWAAMSAHDLVEEIKLIREPADDVAALFEACGAKIDPKWLEKEEAAAKARLEKLPGEKKKAKGKPLAPAKKAARK